MWWADAWNGRGAQAGETSWWAAEEGRGEVLRDHTNARFWEKEQRARRQDFEDGLRTQGWEVTDRSWGGPSFW